LGGGPQRGESYRTVSIGKILADFGAPGVIEYLSLDVEGYEHVILQSFPFDVYKVLVLTIERPDLCSRTILRQHGYLYLRDLGGQDEVWVHPTLPGVRSKLEKYSKREPRRDYVKTQSARMLDKCRQMARNLADGLMKGCCSPQLPQLLSADGQQA
jgi:hypothetical protein